MPRSPKGRAFHPARGSGPGSAGRRARGAPWVRLSWVGGAGLSRLRRTRRAGNGAVASENTPDPTRSAPGGGAAPAWAFKANRGRFGVACPGHVHSRVLHLQRVCPVASRAGRPPSSVEPQTQKGHLSRTPAASRQKGPAGKGWPLSQDRGVPTSQTRPPVLSCCLWGMGWGAWAPLLGPALCFPALTLTTRSPSPPGNHITKVSLHDALSIARSEASDHHWGHNRCSCLALTVNSFLGSLLSKCH